MTEFNGESESLPYQKEKLWRYLDARQWREGIKEVEIRLKHAESPEKRAFYYMFLATLNKCLLRQSRRAGDPEKTADYRGRIESAYLSAIDSSARDVNPRIGFAEFLLSQHKRPVEALDLLHAFRDDDYAYHGDMIFQDHKRLALRGLALATLERMDESLNAYLEAYSPPFQRALRSAYKNSLWIMMKRRIRIPAESADAIIDSLARFPYSRPDNLARIRLGLIEGYVPPPVV